MPTKSQHPETIVLHAGYRSDPTTNAVAVPIYQTTSYQFRDTEHAANLFGLKELGNIYTRIMNPTSAVLEERVAALEGGVAALALASGQAASLFCGTEHLPGRRQFRQLDRPLRRHLEPVPQHDEGRWGSRCALSIRRDPENFRRATDAQTRCYYAETLPNPKLEVFPIAEVAKIGRELGVPLIVDNTAAPVLCRPLDHGAAIVMHSTTKYHRRPRHLDRRHRRRWRQFRLGEARRPLPAAEPAGPELSRRGVDAGGQAAGARSPTSSRCGSTLLRDLGAGDDPVQRLPAHPGAGDVAAAHARALRQRRGGREIPRQASEGHPGHLIRA